MKRYFILFLTLFIFAFQASCQPSNERYREVERIAQRDLTPVEVPTQNGLERAYFASGCFWCVEAVYESVKGVKEAISGYSGGSTQDPSYHNHADHAEAVEVIYDPSVISFSELVDVYFGSQNVTQVNGQGPDHGSSYRSIVFYQNDEQKKTIDAKIKAINQKLDGKEVAAQVLPFQKFWKAEDYHQNFKQLNPQHSYIQNVSIPRLKRFQAKFPNLIKDNSNN